MLSEIKKLFSHSLIYGAGNATGKLVGFLLIPIYTRYLTTEDYGILSLCVMFGAFLFLLLNMGLSSAIFKNYFMATSEKAKSAVISTAGFLMVFVSLPVLILLILKSAWISEMLLEKEVYKNAVMLVAATTFFTLLLKLPFSLMRAREESQKYAVLTVSKTMITIVLTILLVVGLKKGFWGILISQCITALLLCAYLLPKILHKSALCFSKKEAKKLLGFGLPLVAAGIGSVFLTLSDRYILNIYAPLHQVGLYSLGYKFGEILWFLAWAFQLAWPQFLFAHEKSPDAKTLYSQTSTYYLGVMVFVCLSVSILAKEVITIMATPGFFYAYKVIPIISLSQLFYGLFFLSSVGIYLKSKTKYAPIAVGVAAFTNLILNLLWIPKYGMMGAALATLICYFIQFILVLFFSMRLYKIAYEYARILKIIIVSLAIYFVGSSIVFNSTAQSVVFKLLLLMLYPVGLLSLGFFTKRELAYSHKIFAKVAFFGKRITWG